MAFTVQNTPGVPMVTRGRTAHITQALTANNQAVAFTVSHMRDAPNGTDALTITVDGTIAGGTFVLEGSIDSGATWFTVAVSAASAGSNNSTAIVATTSVPDTAATFAGSYNITGLSGPTLFRFGLTAFTSGSGTVWICVP